MKWVYIEAQGRLPERPVDPMRRIEALFKIIAEYLTHSRSQAKAGDEEFEDAREAILELLEIACDLSELKIWDLIEISGSYDGADPDPSPIRILAKRLRSKKCTLADFEAAMVLLEEILLNMHEAFVMGHIPKRGFDLRLSEERYKCACLLREMRVVLHRVWHPVRPPSSD